MSAFQRKMGKGKTADGNCILPTLILFIYITDNWKSFANLCLRKLRRENPHDVPMFDPRGLVVLVVLLDEGGKWVGSLWRGAVGGSLGLDRHLLAVHHQLKPRVGRFKNYEKRLRMSSTCHGSDRTPCELCPNSCCAALHQVIEKCILSKRLRHFRNSKLWFLFQSDGCGTDQWCIHS